MAHFPRKRFGQHFLQDSDVLRHLVSVISPKKEDLLVEIGPGLGALTNEILPHVNHLHLIEIDRDLCQKITQTYSPDKITLHQADALQFDFNTIYSAQKKPLRIVGNLPYNISTPLLFHLLTFSSSIADLIFMLQKEVVRRIVASPSTHDYGRLSVMIQYACQAFPLFEVPPEAFSPPPKVLSQIVKLIPYQGNHPHPLATNKEHFALIVKKAFELRRKTLNNALKSLISPEIFSKANISPQRRAETLSVTDFVTLSNLSIP